MPHPSRDLVSGRYYGVGGRRLRNRAGPKLRRARSLELSPDFMDRILDRSKHKLSDQTLIEHVLPAQADTLLAAADHLYPKPEAEERQPFLLRARSLLENTSEPLDGAKLRLRGKVEAELGEPTAALASYAAALRLDALQTDWRFEYASLLYHQGQRDDALRELKYVLGQQPQHIAANQLLARVKREIAEGK